MREVGHFRLISGAGSEGMKSEGKCIFCIDMVALI